MKELRSLNKTHIYPEVCDIDITKTPLQFLSPNKLLNVPGNAA